MVGRISYRESKTKNVADYPQFHLATYLVFDIEDDDEVEGDQSPLTLNDQMTNEIIFKVKKQITGKKSQVLIDLSKFPKVKVMVKSDGLILNTSLEEARKQNWPIEYMSVIEMLDRYDNQIEATITFLNPEKKSVIHRVVKL